ncbi:MAG: GYD domain-containing protein [Deltaproteobacteria bacterium]|nr:GYD domain-containing protein [Deltaproteobacteria bacterium]
MSKYLLQASYPAEGTKGLLKEGGTARRKAIQQAVEGLGGKLEAFYYAFGETDVFGIAEMPDKVSAAAFSLLVAACGPTLTVPRACEGSQGGRKAGKSSFLLSGVSVLGPRT